jgi:hypothetical protein
MRLNKVSEMSEQQNSSDERLSNLMPFTTEVYIRMAIDMADAFSTREGLPLFSETQGDCDISLAPSPFTEDVVMVVLHTSYFSFGMDRLEVQVPFGNVDIYTSGSVTETDFRVCFYPFLNAPEDRFNYSGAGIDAVGAEAENYLSFASDAPAAQASVVHAFHNAWVDYTGSTDLTEVPCIVGTDNSETATIYGVEFASELAALPVGSIAVQVPLLDDEVEHFMDFLVSRSFAQLRFARVSNPARANDALLMQVGNVLFLHALPL